VLVLALLCGIGLVAFLRSNTEAGPPVPGPPLPSMASPTQTPFAGDLRTLLVTPPKSSRPFASPLSSDGTLTKQLVASTFDNVNLATTVLTDDNFQQGAVVQWHDANETQVTIELLQFDVPANTQNWFRFDARGYSTDANLTDDSPIDSVEGSNLYTAKTPDSDGLVMSIGIAWQGSIDMTVVIWQLKGQNRAAAVSIMKQQFARLP
jgi:hypothetical protein